MRRNEGRSLLPQIGRAGRKLNAAKGRGRTGLFCSKARRVI